MEHQFPKKKMGKTIHIYLNNEALREYLQCQNIFNPKEIREIFTMALKDKLYTYQIRSIKPQQFEQFLKYEAERVKKLEHLKEVIDAILKEKKQDEI